MNTHYNHDEPQIEFSIMSLLNSTYPHHPYDRISAQSQFTNFLIFIGNNQNKELIKFLKRDLQFNRVLRYLSPSSIPSPHLYTTHNLQALKDGYDVLLYHYENFDNIQVLVENMMKNLFETKNTYKNRERIVKNIEALLVEKGYVYIPDLPPRPPSFSSQVA